MRGTGRRLPPAARATAPLVQAELLQLTAIGGAAIAQQAGGLGLVAPGGGEGVNQPAAFDLVELLGEAGGVVGGEGGGLADGRLNAAAAAGVAGAGGRLPRVAGGRAGR